jgi:predicted transcriptional regulator
MIACHMVKEFLIVQANEPLSKVIPLLKKEKQVIVFDNDKYLGVVTRKNILREGMNLPEQKISSIVFMPPAVYDYTSELDVAKYFIETSCHYLPMLNNEDKNKIECVVYRTDFIKDIVHDYMNDAKVSDITNRNVKVILPEDTLAKALSSLHDYGISKLVVYDGKLKGVLTLSTILGQFMHETLVSNSKLQSTLVKEVMKEDVISVDKSERLNKVIKLFVDNNISSVVVLDGSLLYGIITKTDILERYVFALETELKQTSVQISAKFPGVNRTEVEEKFSQLDKFIGEHGKTFVYYKLGKEKFRGDPLISCRVRIIAPKHNYSVHVEGWGVEHATELAVQKLKRQMGDVKF